MEAIFVVTLGLAGAALVVTDVAAASREHHHAAAAANVSVVVVSAKRMSALEKQQSLDAERQLTVHEQAHDSL